MKKTEKTVVGIIVSAVILLCFIMSGFAMLIHGNFKQSTTSLHPFRDFFSSIYGILNKLQGRVVFEDYEGDFLLLKNGYLALKNKDVDPNIYTEKIYSLKQFLDDNNINMEWVITAEGGDERQGQLPKGVKTNYCEKVSNKMITLLENGNINYTYTYNYLANSELDYYDYFYKTDHHWNDYAGLYLAKVIAQQLNTNYNLSLDESLLDLDNHTVKKYKKFFYGKLGKKAGHGYSKSEDFDMLIPKYKTNFSVSELNQTGSYEKAIIYKQHLDKTIPNSYPYSAFLYGNPAETNIINHNTTDNTRILILKDSKATIVASHLACVVKYIDILDLRAYEDSVKDYITKTKPDVVMVMQSPFAAGLLYDFD